MNNSTISHNLSIMPHTERSMAGETIKASATISEDENKTKFLIDAKKNKEERRRLFEDKLANRIATDIFKNFDSDKNGHLDKNEAKGVFSLFLKNSGSTHIQFDKERFDKWFAKADENKDGFLSYNETLNFVKKFMIKKRK